MIGVRAAVSAEWIVWLHENQARTLARHHPSEKRSYGLGISRGCRPAQELVPDLTCVNTES